MTFRYLRLKKDKKCPNCERVRKECHKIRYGSFLAAVVARFHNEHQEAYNEHDAVCIFLETYMNIAEFDDYIDDLRLDPISNSVILPLCMAYDSLVFALNLVEWTVVWERNQKKIKSLHMARNDAIKVANTGKYARKI